MFERLANRVSDLYHRSSIRYTVFLSFTLSALIAIVMTGVTFYVRFSDQLETTLHGENQILVEQVTQSLNVQLRNMIRLSNTVSYKVIKNMDISSPAVDEQLQLLYDANESYIKNIALFSADGAVLGTAPPSIRKDTAVVTEEGWFVRALERTENLHFATPAVQNLFMDAENQYSWTVSLSCATEITQDKSARQGVLLIDLRYNAISELFRGVTLANDGYVYLMDGEGEIIYHPQHQLLVSGLIRENNLELAGYRDGEYVLEAGDGQVRSVIVRSVGYTGWKIIGIIPQRGLTLGGMQNMLFVVVIFLLYFAIIVLINGFLSSKLTGPIKNLERSVQQIEQDIAHAEIYVGGSYELQHLGHSIQQMVNLMRKLTSDIVQEQEQKQKSELNALQAQINPHFLYNTLDILVWMIEKGQPEDALKIVSALGRFFRLSLSKGKNIISVQNELEHVSNYLMIQQMRYKNKFNYTIEAEEGTLQLSTLKLVLQPIVENAIYHSIDFMMDGDGQIDIRTRLEGGDLYLSVQDNGLGMPQEVVDRLLVENTTTSKGSGIGLKNVHERIALYFGEQYGVIIESEPDVGTNITLHLPAVLYRETEGNR